MLRLSLKGEEGGEKKLINDSRLGVGHVLKH
jgi:hypothetical protein